MRRHTRTATKSFEHRCLGSDDPVLLPIATNKMTSSLNNPFASTSTLCIYLFLHNNASLKLCIRLTSLPSFSSRNARTEGGSTEWRVDPQQRMSLRSSRQRRRANKSIVLHAKVRSADRISPGTFRVYFRRLKSTRGASAPESHAPQRATLYNYFYRFYARDATRTATRIVSS